MRSLPRKWLSALVAAAVSTTSVLAVPAFPGAEGFGAQASGGRGGSVYIVTNLNDSGAGSFRDAVSQPNRTIVFAVGGVIRINSRISVKANITIAGQTAPGDGITIYGNGISFTDANNSITRYIRFREGIVGDSGTDAVGIASGDKMIFDHVSASWGRDETFSVSGTPSNITLQDCIVGQGLLVHSAGGLMQTSGGVSVFRCLYTDNWMRNPKVKGVHEFTNNVVYNWGSGGGYIMGGDSAGQTFANIINNYFIDGPNTVGGAFKTGNLNFHAYAVNNFEDSNRNGVLDGVVVSPLDFTTADLVPTQYPYPAVSRLLTPQQAYQHVITYAGASKRRDAVDTFMVSEVTSLGTVGAQITSEDQVGGPGTLVGGLAPKDTDADGMPDWWEAAAGLDPNTPDNNGDANGDGYTNLENYLNSLVPAGIPGAVITGITSDTGTAGDDGITSDTTIALKGTALPSSVVTISRVDLGVLGTTTADGSGAWTFDYSGTPLADRYYVFTAVGEADGITSPPSAGFRVKIDTAAAATPVITSFLLSPSTAINGSGEPGDVVTVTLQGVGVVGSATTDELGNWSVAYTGPALSPSVHTFVASSVDVAGNAGSPSQPFSVDLSMAAPVITGIANDSGASNSDGLTNDSTLIFSGTAPANSTVQITRVGTGVAGSVAASAGGTWTFDYTGIVLANGTYSFSATAIAGGNASPASAAFNVTVDSRAPTVSAIRRRDPSTTATVESTLTYRVTFSENVNGVDLADFALTLSGVTATLSSVTPVDGANYDVKVTGASGDGTARLDLKSSGTGIVDIAGNAISGGFTAGQAYTLRLLGSGVWLQESDGLWSDASNWVDSIIAQGTGATADFGTLDISTDVSVQLDTARTVGRLVFGDIDDSTAGTWTLTNAASPSSVLTMSMPTGAANVQVVATGTGADADIAAAASANPATLDVPITAPAGLTKTGLGTAIVTKGLTLGGPLTVSNGYFKVGPGSTVTPPSVGIGVSSQLHIAGGTFSTSGNTAVTAGGFSGVVVSGGSASFTTISPTNSRNTIVKVTGGSLTADSVMFLRSADAANMWTTGLIVQGGAATFSTVGLGTNNSWGNMSVEGGTLTITGPLWVGWQVTATRGGQMRVTGGTFNSTDTTDGVVMSRKNGTNANNVAQAYFLGGTANIQKLTLGYDANVNLGSATVTLDGGKLYLGSSGIVRNGTGSFVTNINLTSGLLGALDSWNTVVPMNLLVGTTPVEIRAANSAGLARDITLSGVLSGAGGFNKTGAGRLTLTASNTYTGPVTITEGVLDVSGSTAATSVTTVDLGGTLAGTGTVNGPIVLQNGGVISPAADNEGTLNAANLTWNAGGILRIQVGASSDRLALTGALTKGAAGTFPVAFQFSAYPVAGTVLTLATFGSTDFAATDFTATGGLYGTFAIAGNALTFTVKDPPGTAYKQWLEQYSLPLDARGVADDPDFDGSSNLLEFVLAGNPAVAGAGGIQTIKVTVGQEDYPALAFVRRTQVGDTELEVRASADLSFQTNLGTVLVSATPRGDGSEDVIFRSSVPLAQLPRQFLRLFVSIPNF